MLAVRNTGLGHLVADLAPSSQTIVGLLITAALGAVLANLFNNLPATLLLVPVVARSPGLVLGVNMGPNLTYVGSLATLLWREVLHARDHAPDTRTFLKLGALTVQACIVATCGALWLALEVTGTT